MTNPATLEHQVFFTLVQIILIIFSARVAGFVATRLNQSRSVGEIVVGLLLGPSLFGWLAPEAFHWVFKSTDSTVMSIMSQIGLILLMFQVGMEFDFSLLKDRNSRRSVIFITALSIVVPFGLGLGFGIVSQDTLSPLKGEAFPLFIGIALAITAVPILGRILMEFDLTHSKIGVITIASAAANDAIGWILLAAISATVAQGHFSLTDVSGRILMLTLYVFFSLMVMRRMLKRLIRRWSSAKDGLPSELLTSLLLLIFSSALVTSRLGIFAIFGGFMAGVLVHDQRGLVLTWRERISPFINIFFLPIFFTFTGLRTDIGSLASTELWYWCGALIFIAFFGKLSGCFVAGRCSGLSNRESVNIAILMNTRALMELVVANIGLDLGVISPSVYTMLVLMAVLSTLATTPLLRWTLDPKTRPSLTVK